MGLTYPSNKICPRCGKGGYINYIGQSNIYEAKCYNCGYYFAFGELDLYEEKKPVTNADCIRAMADEELAEFMVRTGTEYSCPPPHYFGKNEYCQKHLPDCKKCWLDWLKEEEVVAEKCGFEP